MRRPTRPLRLAAAIGGVLALGLTGLAAAPATAAPWNLQARIDAAPAGSTIRLPAGVLAGGITISKSLQVVGAGSGRTILRGGNSVVTVTSPGGERPTVTLADLTLTGGVARGSADDRFEAYGGGLLVEGAGDGVGATVTLRRVVVSGNRAEPSTTSPSPSGAACPGGDCPYALAAGGGIASFGTLTLDHSVVRGDTATGRVSDAQGGGVWSARGALRVIGSTITGNTAEPTANTIGRFAEGGGLWTGDADGVGLTVSSSRIDGNRSVLTTRWPVFAAAGDDAPIDLSAQAGGVHVGAGRITSIDRTSIDGNSVVAVDPHGEPLAFDSGLIQVYAGRFSLTRSTVDGNAAKVVAATADDVDNSGTAIELDGAATVSDTSISRNVVTAVGVAGSAYASNGVAVYAFEGSQGTTALKRVLISGNTATATSSTADAHVLGVGVLNNSELTVTDSAIRGNRGTAVSSDATAQGGGIWNGAFLSGPPVDLRVVGTVVTGNRITAKGGTAQGGGVYDDGGDGVSISLAHSTRVTGNAPDQVFLHR